MHIIFFTENFYCGGLDTFLLSLVNHWPDKRDRLTIICNEDHPGLATLEGGLRRQCEIMRHDVPFYGKIVARYRRNRFFDMIRIVLSPILQYGFFLYNVFAFQKLFMRCSPDRLMIVNGGYPGGDTCRAASIGWGLVRRGAQSVHNFHNLVTKPRVHTRLPEWLVDRLVLANTSFFVTVSRASAESMSIRPVIAGAGKTTFINNGVEPPVVEKPEGDPRTVLGIGNSAPVCLMLGTYEPRKGHDFLLRSFKQVVKRVPDARLIICGYGSSKEMETVRSLIELNELGGIVHILGFRRDRLSLLRASDVLLIASQSFESFGLTAVEAMAYRIPVVATRVGGLSEVVEDGDGGWCVDKDDIESYTEHIVQLLQNETLRIKQGQLGFERYKRMFTVERMTLEYAAIVKA